MISVTAEARSAVLYAHTWGSEFPDYIGIISDALILNPWDREIIAAGAFQFHPELAEAIALQGSEPGDFVLAEVKGIQLAKGPTIH